MAHRTGQFGLVIGSALVATFAAGASLVAVTPHAASGGSIPVSGAHGSPTGMPQSTATLTLAGAVTGSVTLTPAQIRCTYTLPSRPWLIEADGSLNGSPVSVSVQYDRGFAQAFVERAGSVWTTGTDPAAGSAPGITDYSTGRRVSLDAALTGIASGTNLHLRGSIACPAPGTPSVVTLTGAIKGSLQVASVNCDEQLALQGSATGIDVYGTVNGAPYDLALRADSVTLTGAGPQIWEAMVAPSRFDGAKAAHLTTELEQLQDGTPTMGSVHVSATVTCPS